MPSNQTRITVLKFGSSVLRSEDDLSQVVHEIYREWRSGSQVLAVVSALGNSTDNLLQSAARISSQPDESALAALLATGESTSAALLGLALHKAGIPAKVLDPAQAALRTSGNVHDAELISADIRRLHSELRSSVVVLPGFVGRDEDGGTTLLGRGGSDFTALFLAQQLGGHCVLVKDVNGLYTSDPANAALRPLRFTEAKYETACRVGGPVVQPKAVRFAQTRKVKFSIRRIGALAGTEIGSYADRLVEPEPPSSALRVALLGCGTVGAGVYERLAALPEQFTVTGIGVRDTNRSCNPALPKNLLTEYLERLIDQPCDVVVELIGGVDRSFELLSHALRSGRNVVTANKALIAAKGEQLKTIAAENRVTIRYCAAVGGAMPALERIQHAKAAGRIESISGVLNGTTNYILDQLAKGSEFDASVRAAQAAGYAEADPTLDLDGTDAAQKLALLVKAAFNFSLPFQAIEREGIEHHDAKSVTAAIERKHRVRLVASCQITADGIKAKIAPVELPDEHPLASVTGAQNRLVIDLEGGERLTVSGTGAGRYPTTEAVIADLLDLHREVVITQTNKTEPLEECVA
jgi:homoserine dehydrogenase